MKTLIKNGTLITASDTFNADILIEGETISRIGLDLEADADQVVLVEGQADAITFGEWGFPALAVAGMHVSDDLLTALRKHRRVFVALDNTTEAMQKNREI
ncbi:MAG TPA: hypothetical protein PLE14_10890, partial [Anaerolineales bacterium]|nr:hypothetical protein [Anaerolineales bacterium]